MVNDEIAATCKTDGNSTIDNVRCNIFLRKFETLANRILAEPPRWQVFLVAFFLERLSLPLLLFLPSGCEGSLLPPFSSFPALLVNRKKKLLLSLLSLLFVSFFSTGHSRLKERAKFNNNGQGKKKQCLSNAQANLFVRLLPCSTISSWLNPEPKDAAYCPLEKKAPKAAWRRRGPLLPWTLPPKKRGRRRGRPFGRKLLFLASPLAPKRVRSMRLEVLPPFLFGLNCEHPYP